MSTQKSRKNLFALPLDSWLATCTAISIFALIGFAGSFNAQAAAAKDRTKPTNPTNFRVTAVTPFSASLAWGPSSDNSGNFTYRLWSTSVPGGTGGVITLPKTATSFTWKEGMRPRNSYTLGLYAIDAAGNASAQVSVSVTTPPDTTAPSKAPVVSVVDVGSSYVSLAWTPAEDDGPYLFYYAFVNGAYYASSGAERAITLRNLTPATNYTITVQATDYGNNLSPHSNPVAVTTDPANPSDNMGPTTPGNLYEMNWCDEVHLFWEQSTDNFDAQSNLRYDVYVNGVFDHSLFASGGPAIVYGIPHQQNTFQVIAVDTAGNASAPATLVVNLCE